MWEGYVFTSSVRSHRGGGGCGGGVTYGGTPLPNSNPLLPPSPPRQTRKQSQRWTRMWTQRRGGGVGGTPLVVTQEDFLVLDCTFKSCRKTEVSPFYVNLHNKPHSECMNVSADQANISQLSRCPNRCVLERQLERSGRKQLLTKSSCTNTKKINPGPGPPPNSTHSLTLILSSSQGWI